MLHHHTSLNVTVSSQVQGHGQSLTWYPFYNSWDFKSALLNKGIEHLKKLLQVDFAQSLAQMVYINITCIKSLKEIKISPSYYIFITIL